MALCLYFRKLIIAFPPPPPIRTTGNDLVNHLFITHQSVHPPVSSTSPGF
uniref:Uncharacterized protein n=1 Tax=Octopus bimaculoides TaxID=37653 RepID=A0A0L8HTW1_OCTBM